MDNQNDLMKLEKYLLQDMPNTYTLSKRYAENMIEESNLHMIMLIGIFRPPIGIISLII